MGRDIKRYYLLIIFGLIMAMLICELAARILTRDSNGIDSGLKSVSFHPPKSDKVINLLILGESTAHGAAYDPKASPAAVAVSYLQEALPDFTFKKNVVAWGGSLLEENIRRLSQIKIIDRPDIVVVIAGHNLFLSSFSARSQCSSTAARVEDSLLSYSAFLRWMLPRIKILKRGERPDSASRDFFDKPVVCPFIWRQTLASFGDNLSAIADFCNSHNIPLLVFLTAGNEADTNPTRSVYKGQQVDQKNFKALFNTGQKHSLSGNFSEAAICFEEARKIDGNHAENLFWLGRTYLELNNLGEATKFFGLARDLDGFPWRAISDERTILKETAEKKFFKWFDIRDIIQKNYPHSVLGSDLFYDRHHMAIGPYNLVGFEIAKQVCQQFKCDPQGLQQISEKDLARKVGFTKSDLLKLLKTTVYWYRNASGYQQEQIFSLRTMIDYMVAHEMISEVPATKTFGQLYADTCRNCENKLRALANIKALPSNDSQCSKIQTAVAFSPQEMCCSDGKNKQELFTNILSKYPWMEHTSN